MPTNSVLKALPVSLIPAGTSFRRAGFSAAGDSEAIDYVLSSSACALNSGAGDNLSQVSPNSGRGCWKWAPPQGGVTPISAGAAGDGSTLDTAAVQAAHEAAAAAGIPLRFGPPYLYKVGTIAFDTPGDWEGPFRYGAWSQGTSITKCPWGLVASSTSQGDVIRASAATGTIRQVCIDATGSVSKEASSGAGIDLAPSSRSGYQSGWNIEGNTLLGTYDGIDVNGAGHNSACCGAGTAADGVSVTRNTIVNPARYGISNGLNTAGASTVGITYTDNVINCGVSGAARGAAGFAMFDGGVTYDGTNNGPEGCAIGFLVAPGTASGAGQNAQLVLHGALGDQSTAHDLLISPARGGTLDFVQADGVWMGATGSVQSALIDCTRPGTSCQEINFNDAVVHGGNGASSIFSVQAGAGGPYDLSITGSNICSFGVPAPGATALILNVGAGPTGRFVISGNRIGTGCPGNATQNGIGLSISTGSTSHGAVTIANNDLSAVSTPFSYAPNASDHVIYKNNMGSTDQISALNAAPTVDLPASFEQFGITGSRTIGALTGAWANREVLLTLTTPVTFGSGGNICPVSQKTYPEFTQVAARYNGGWSCWNIR